MSNLTRRPGNRLSRREREGRAYNLVVTGMGAGAVTVVSAVLAIVGIIGWTLPVLALVVAVVCLALFRRTVGR